MEVTLTSTSITFTEEGYVLRFTGTDLVRAYYKYENLPEFNTVSAEWYIHLVLDGSVREALGRSEYIFPLSANLLTNQATWTTGAKDGSGAQAAINAIKPVIRALPAGGGGGSVTDVTATAPLTSTGGATPDIAIAALGIDASLLAPNAVTTTKIIDDAVTNAKLANMAQATFKGRTAGSGTGDPQDLTANQASTILDGATDPFVRTSAVPGSQDLAGVLAVGNGTGGTDIDIDAGDRIVQADATVSTIAIWDGAKELISADTATYPNLTELSYVKGVTSAIQTQLNAKGDVVGPASAVDSNVALFNGTTGKLIKDGGTFGSNVRASLLTGLSLVTSQVIAATDTVLQAFGYLQAQITLKADKSIAIRTYTGTTDTLVIGDAGNMVRGNNAGANTCTIPLNAVVAFPIGTQILFVQRGAGQMSIAITGGGALNSYGGALKLVGQYAQALATKVDTDEWSIDGNLTT